VSIRALSPEGPFGQFADRLLGIELPDLPDDRRDDAVAFVCRRANEVPTPLRVGVTVLSAGAGFAGSLFGTDRTTAWLRSTRLPLVSELSRMIRSLAFAYVWETWPRTSQTGRPGAEAGS